MADITIPGKCQEARNGHGIEEGIPNQWPPIQVQYLKTTRDWDNEIINTIA